MTLRKLVMSLIPPDGSVSADEMTAKCLGRIDPARCCRAARRNGSSVEDHLRRGTKALVSSVLSTMTWEGKLHSAGGNKNTRYAKPGVPIGVITPDTQYLRALAMLRRGPIRTDDLGRFRSGASIASRSVQTLKSKGFVIAKARVDHKEWEYTLVSEPDSA